MRFVVVQSTLLLLGVASWSLDGVERARQWVSPDGRLSLQSQVPRMPTGLDLWPAMPSAEVPDALAEITLHRTLWNDPCVERMGIAAMPDVDGDYRISIERGDGCNQGFAPRPFRSFRICFDTPPGDRGTLAGCKLIIRPDGLWTTDDGRSWRRL